MTYEELDLNQRINLKGAIADWTRYAVEHFQESIDRVLITDRTNRRSGVTSTRLSRGYRFGMGRESAGQQRTGNLRKRWWQNVSGGDNAPRAVMEFLMYGRYVDMGVGRGADIADHITNRRLRMGSPGRTPRRWYAKKKGYELHRLREILAERYVSVPVDLLENALSLSLPIPL
ncbi:hypothetical protein [Fibrella forsythiae]|uniref:Uncharacterized protein n=1 Tax=Fibrella forsythiae TaxID=2817061 RepID=A0ABS3JCG6_9BACT|nr:hypothetical protein [Fibrella forsythiae]MBO0946964.1 hypothetical protein [Fibrella forsythiae]